MSIHISELCLRIFPLNSLGRVFKLIRRLGRTQCRPEGASRRVTQQIDEECWVTLLQAAARLRSSTQPTI